MARKVTMQCDFCGAEIEQAAAKLYLAPVMPGNSLTSYMSRYSHWADACASCMEDLIPKMHKRKARPESNGAVKKTTKKRSKA